MYVYVGDSFLRYQVIPKFLHEMDIEMSKFSYDEKQKIWTN